MKLLNESFKLFAETKALVISRKWNGKCVVYFTLNKHQRNTSTIVLLRHQAQLKCKQCITERGCEHQPVCPRNSCSEKRESHILAKHSESLKGKMSFIFKLLKFPFPFDCFLKLLCISLAQRADSPLNKTILQTILFLGILN